MHDLMSPRHEGRDAMRHVVVVGAGVAGIAAAVRAGQQRGVRVSLIDDNPRVGGQIWRQSTLKGARDLSSLPKQARWWFEELSRAAVVIHSGATALDIQDSQLIYYKDELHRLPFDSLILATGARELFLPFPGWTLPGVMGAGGLQALHKSGLSVQGKKVVVAGTGPLLLAVAASLSEAGAQLVEILEQAPMAQLLRFSASLLATPSKALEALVMRLKSFPSAYRTGSWVTHARGSEQLEQLTVSDGRRERTIACDYLACGYGLLPNLELPRAMKLSLGPDGVLVDSLGQSSRATVFCAGEAVGIGGRDLALIEGQIAGYAGAGALAEAHSLIPEKRRFEGFRQLLKSCFAVRDEVKALSRPETLVCRCEDVCYRELSKFKDQRSAKLNTRLAMGACQGRICGPIGRVLFDWSANTVRLPLCPIPVKALCSFDNRAEERIR
jgi:D-hydroxyproline dehydrogenase subunit alpha